MANQMRDDLVQKLKSFQAGRAGSAETLADLMLGTTPEQVSQASQQQQGQAGQFEAGDTGLPVLYTYADGSQRLGRPPFPPKSPKEEEAEARRNGNITPQMPQQGQTVAGVDPGSVSTAQPGMTPEQAAFAAQQQLTSDVLSGKSPYTPNPTTSHDKPNLAGADNVLQGGEAELQANAEPTQADLDRIASQIEPAGNIEATPQEKEAAAVQVLRESKGVPQEPTEIKPVEAQSEQKADKAAAAKKK